MNIWRNDTINVLQTLFKSLSKYLFHKVERILFCYALSALRNKVFIDKHIVVQSYIAQVSDTTKVAGTIYGLLQKITQEKDILMKTQTTKNIA